MFDTLVKINYAELVHETCSTVGTTLANRALAASSDAAHLVGLEVNPACYDDAVSYFADAQAAALVKKACFLPNGFSSETRSELTLAADLRREAVNKDLNASFHELLDAHGPLLRLMRARLEEIIPDGPGLATLYYGGRFGPGSNAGVRSASPNIFSKIRTGFTYTDNAAAMVQVLARSLPAMSYTSLENGKLREKNRQSGERFAVVSKHALIDRSIGTQPSGNLWLQFGIARYLINCARSIGLLLPNGPDINGNLAAFAHVWKLATIDLKNASSSIYTALVKYLLANRPRLLEVMFATRCEELVLPDGTHHSLQRMSAMGNGYTFEFQTLLFHSLAYATAILCESRPLFPSKTGTRGHNVVGDDIVLPQHLADALVENLRVLGFEVNLEKTFTKGRFFESCGKDYYDGQLVRPVYWNYETEELDHAEALVLANRFYGRRAALGDHVDRYNLLNTIRLRVLAGMSNDFRDKIAWSRDTTRQCLHSNFDWEGRTYRTAPVVDMDLRDKILDTPKLWHKTELYLATSNSPLDSMGKWLTPRVKKPSWTWKQSLARTTALWFIENEPERIAPIDESSFRRMSKLRALTGKKRKLAFSKYFRELDRMRAGKLAQTSSKTMAPNYYWGHSLG